MNFNNILIGSEDPKRLADYYTKLFGAPGMDEGGYVGWQIGSGFVAVGPHDQVHGTNAQPGRLIWNIESDDVKGDFERFKAAGATVVREPYKVGPGPDSPTGATDSPAGGTDAPADAPDYWIATFSDPDDNYFQLMSPYTP
jgi:predicted enzyme related to lactoylglutathione lyase